MTDTTPSTNPSATAAPALVHVPFHGDTLDATRAPDGRVWVSVRRVCEALGIQPHGQAEKLKTKPWAVTQMICATGPDGKRYESFCLDLDSLPMWLATIDTRRVKGAAREKLVVYQREAARVLRDYFLGDGPDPLPPAASGTRGTNAKALVSATEFKMLLLHLGANAELGTGHIGNAVRFAVGVHPDDGEVAAATLSQFSAELSLVREALHAIDREAAVYATMADVQSVLGSLGRRALGIAQVAQLMSDADASLVRRVKHGLN